MQGITLSSRKQWQSILSQCRERLMCSTAATIQRKSYGGSAWLIRRDAGNVLVDSPRFDPKLIRNIKVHLPLQCSMASLFW